MNINNILSDRFYRELYFKYPDFKILTAAGYFDDAALLDYTYNTNWLSTPLDKLKNKLSSIDFQEAQNKPLTVLLSTGGFAPLHKGHLKMMELAKQKLETMGHIVLAGFFSPSHDEYVLSKYNKSIKLTIEERIWSAALLIKDSAWLDLDPWEGRYNTGAINFTKVISRLEEYINYHIKSPSPIKVAYVYGSDNYDFGLSFIGSGVGICVERDKVKSNYYNIIKDLNNVLFCENTSQYKQINSSKIRNKKNKNIHKYYGIRNDAQYLNLNSEYDSFMEKIKNSIKEIFDQQDINTKILNKSNKFSINKKGTLSLDPLFEGEFNLKISRLFSLSSEQMKPIKLVARPGAIDLYEQIKSISSNEVTLVDDDVGSGYTLKNIINILKNNNIKVKDIQLLSNQHNQDNFYDIVDTRDFLIGSKDGGLVCKLPNDKIIRAPYLWPYVSLKSRGKIPPKKEKEIMIKIWEINHEYYIKNPKLLKESDAYFIDLMTYIGFTPESSLADIAGYHLKVLKQINTKDL